MFDALSIISPIFILIGVGFFSVRAGVFTDTEMRVLGRFVVSFALPALIFRATAFRPIGDIYEPVYLLVVLVGSLTVFAAGYFVSVKVLKNQPISAVFHAMGMSCANSGFIGFPILLLALPEVAPESLALNMTVENLVMIPITIALAERIQAQSKNGEMRILLFKLLRNPIILALSFGLLVSFLDIEIPEFLATPVDFIANSSAALSLLVIGGILAVISVADVNASTLLVVSGKLILHPVAIVAGFVLLSVFQWNVVDVRLQDAAIIMAATPAMGIYPLLAQQYGEGASASVAMFFMTLFSFMTMAVFLFMIF